MISIHTERGFDVNLAQNGTRRPSWMVKTVDRVVVLKLAKTSFNGFKHTYNVQQDAVRARNELFLNQDSRRWLRRMHVSGEHFCTVNYILPDYQQKAEYRRKAVPTFRKRYGLNPTCFLERDMMSDEASCEEGCVASDKPEKIEWVRKVAAEIIAPGADEEILGNFEVFEVIRPAWRSKEVIGSLVSHLRMTDSHL
jgi:hypothetical protein